MLNFLATATIATYMALSQPVTNPPDTSKLETTKQELEMVVKMLTNKSNKHVEFERIDGNTGTRYTYELENGIIIDGKYYGTAVLTYIKFDKAQDRYTATFIDYENGDLIVLYDGNCDKYKSVPDGNPDIEVILKDVSLFRATRLKIESFRKSSDINSVHDDDVHFAKEKNKHYFHILVDKVLYNK
jgi:hypothetical protein